MQQSVDLFGTANNGVYKSTDSGATWTLLNAAPAPVGATFGRISIAISKASNTNVLYIAAEDNTTTGHLARFVRSDNAGASFTDLTAGTPNYMGGQGWYDTTLLVDPTSSAIVYAAGAARRQQHAALHRQRGDLDRHITYRRSGAAAR